MRFERDMQTARLLSIYATEDKGREEVETGYFITSPVSELELTTEGIVGDRHFGYQTFSGNRLTSSYARGTTVRNNRQWSAISPGELETLASNLNLSGSLTPEILGINILIEGVECLSQLSPMTYLTFSPESTFKAGRPEDTTLVVYGEVLPCTIAGKALAREFDDISLEGRFPRAAKGIRGTTGWVDKGGIIRPDYTVFVRTPTGKT
jgi:hypothetical protein